jgi:hypothetical protein
MVFLCEVCGRVVAPGERAARVLAETCVIDRDGGRVARPDGQEVILAVFHEECVSGTCSARECDVVAYISEAREVIQAGEVS